MKATASFLGKVRQALDRLAVGKSRLVVAVSGGPDSVALAHAMVQLGNGGDQVPEPRLVLAHLNHQLRGAESDADEEFVRAFHTSLSAGRSLALQLRCERLDVAAQARAEKGNLESVARRLRYDWLASVARNVCAPFVATGHTADDQAETVLHRLLRGTGLRGLRGIAERRRIAPDVEVIRPLLRTTRREVLAYLEAHNQPARQDSSNANRQFTRNRIRLELLPHLAKHYNPAIAALLGQLAEQAALAYQEHEAAAWALLRKAERPRSGNRLVFDLQQLAARPRHLVREMFRLAWFREGWPGCGMGFREWDRLASVAFGEVMAVDLPGPIRARRRERVVLLGPVR
jgi:tRNA(Ile)-lysidine synthase